MTALHNSLQCAHHTLDLSRPQVMGILNVTPDSFSDGGQFILVDRALHHARQMVDEGAAIIDVGGESTRPGAAEASLAEELGRVLPVIEALSAALPHVVISIDTSKAEVMRAAVRAGAAMINDVCGLQQADALETVTALEHIPVCLMHMQGRPRTMQRHPSYQDVVEEVLTFLQQRIWACEQAGIARERIVADPGFGFGKTLEHNYSLLHHLQEFHRLQVPLLVGMSRKSMIGAVLDQPLEQRLTGSVAAAVIAAWQGASIIRVHDVRPTVEALKICHAAQNAP